ncbi:hypothetical protein [Paenibacillus sp. BC26]|uniref:hypothetical protein n=1 Tax=Paenibacillus sp. BC26 TaxID=1881032 RepID=UPI0011603B39|nr:hypothetical protein [Paenibacillus sp. BC26]
MGISISYSTNGHDSSITPQAEAACKWSGWLNNIYEFIGVETEMSKDKIDRRKVRRQKRRAALSNSYEVDKSDAQVILDAVFSYINDRRHEPRMILFMVSRDQGETWTDELVNIAVTDPNLSTLKIGDWVKKRGDETTYVIVANEGENKIHGAFQDDPDSPLFLPEGHLYQYALPYT